MADVIDEEGRAANAVGLPAPLRRLYALVQLGDDRPGDGDRCIHPVGVSGQVRRVEGMRWPRPPVLVPYAKPRHHDDGIAQAWSSDFVGNFDHLGNRF